MTGRRQVFGGNRGVVAVATAAMLAIAACTAAPQSGADLATDSTTVAAASRMPTTAIAAVLDKSKYADASWSMLVTDLSTGKTMYSLRPDELALTGSTRKLFSVGLALRELGADHRSSTPVYRRGAVDENGVLHGDLVLVGAGDLTLGGRRTPHGGLAFTDFDHNDANNLGTAILTPQDPLHGVDELARQISESGITGVRGDVAIDDRLFPAYRVPNNDLLISPTMLNENMVDVTVTPTRSGELATMTYRPRTGALQVINAVRTTAAGTEPALSLPAVDGPGGMPIPGLVTCVGQSRCTATVSGTIPIDYRAPLSGEPAFVGTFRVENPANFVRIALIEALQRAGVGVTAPTVAPNPVDILPAATGYPAADRVAALVSPPFAAQAALVLKVSLNLGANLALTQFGMSKGDPTLEGALAAERRVLADQLQIPGDAIDFPTNGSGSPDSRATPRAIVDLLAAMSRTDVANEFRRALPVLGVDGSLSRTGSDLAAKGHVFAKTGTTIDDGELEAQTLAGYIDTRQGHRLAFAICLNHFGPINSIEGVSQVFADEAAITDVLYRSG